MHGNPSFEHHLWVQPRHGHEVPVGELLDLLATTTLQAEGCLDATLHRLENGWRLDGRWSSSDALDLYLEQPALQRLGDALARHCRMLGFS
ncbi:hypothetical protein D3C78_661880 [compost metagenome]